MGLRRVIYYIKFITPIMATTTKVLVQNMLIKIYFFLLQVLLFISFVIEMFFISKNTIVSLKIIFYIK